MTILRFFILLLTVAEVVALVAAIKLFGFWLTLGLILLSFIAGGALLRAQGLATARTFASKLQQGLAPMDEAFDGICLIIAAVLLMIPGLLTDALALLLLLPYARRAMRRLLARQPAVQSHYWFAPRKAPSQDNLINPQVIEASYVEVTPPVTSPER